MRWITLLECIVLYNQTPSNDNDVSNRNPYIGVYINRHLYIGVYINNLESEGTASSSVISRYPLGSQISYSLKYTSIGPHKQNRTNPWNRKVNKKCHTSIIINYIYIYN